MAGKTTLRKDGSDVSVPDPKKSTGKYSDGMAGYPKDVSRPSSAKSLIERIIGEPSPLAHRKIGDLSKMPERAAGKSDLPPRDQNTGKFTAVGLSSFKRRKGGKVVEE